MMGPLVTFLSLLIFQTGCARMPSTWFAAIRDDPTPQAPENHQPRLQLKSDPGSTITPEFDVQGLSEGETVMVLRGADANCSSGSIVGSRVAKASALIPRIRTLNPGASGTTAEFRAKVRRADGTVFCSEAVTVNLPAGTLPASTPYFIQTLPEAQELTSWAGSPNSACALTRQGTVWCWGSNIWGQRGNGQTGGPFSISEASPVSGLSDIVKVAANSAGSYSALAGSGALYWWGKRNSGNDSPQSNQPALLGQYPSVLQMNKGFILSDDGTLTHLGAFRSTGLPDEIVATQVSSSYIGLDDHWCIRSQDGSTSCYAYWDLPDGSQQWKLERVPGVVNSIELSPNSAFQCALTAGPQEDRQVSCWANRSTIQSEGYWAPTDSLTAQVIPISGVRHLFAGLDGISWISEEGLLYQMNSSSGAQLKSDLHQVVSLASNSVGGCALQEAGTVMCWQSW